MMCLPPTTPGGEVIPELILRLRHACGLRSLLTTAVGEGSVHWARRHFERVQMLDALGLVGRFALERGTGAVVWVGSAPSGPVGLPILDLIDAMNEGAGEDVLIVAGAHRILSPQPMVGGLDVWPGLTDVVGALNRGPDRYVVVHEDHLIAVPVSARLLLARFCQQANGHREVEAEGGVEARLAA